MLRYVTSDGLACEPMLAESMFRDRAQSLRQRPDWPDQAAAGGPGRDRYDAQNPIHVIWQGLDGRHGGSLRLLPTLGRTAVNDGFRHLGGGRRFAHPKLWEWSQLCLPDRPGAPSAAVLLLGLAEAGVRFGLARAIAVIDGRTEWLCRQLGWGPVVLGQAGEGPDRTSLGLWEFSESTRCRMAAQAGIAPDQSRAWFDRAFAGKNPAVAAG